MSGDWHMTKGIRTQTILNFLDYAYDYYIENEFAIRIEDSLIVKERPVVMHKFTKDLVTI